MKTINLKLSALCLSLVFLAACGDKKAEETTQEVDTTAAEPVDTAKGELNEVVDFKFHVFIANIPSPLESMVLIPDAGIVIDKTQLNPVENADKYTSSNKKALNYGVYGVDLGYLTAYEQNEEVADYFATLKSLAEELGAADQFNKVLSDRFQANMGNRDSLLVIMDKAFGETENYLKNNQRLETATLMLTGSWVESQFLLVRGLIEANGKGDLVKLYEKIPQQRAHLKSLIDLLGEQKSNKDCALYKKELEEIQKVYEPIQNIDVIDEKVLNNLSTSLKGVKNKITGK
ncbi:MAG TPA: hypothetical protein VK177_12385 [Flavobacteriales bacterium]|nr:hypothetical protein [Flavobacteriales bacterium]